MCNDKPDKKDFEASSEESVDMLQVAGIKKESVVDGPGVCSVLFVQGCLRNCPGCQNPLNQPLNDGVKMEINEVLNELCSSHLIETVVFSGGEPFLQASALVVLGNKIREKGLKVIIYTGYSFEELMEEGTISRLQLLKIADILVDGPYLQEKRDVGLPFQGSRNQRFLNVKESLKRGIATLYGKEKYK